MNCPSCQTPLPPAARFCGVCGHQLAAPQPAPARPPSAAPVRAPSAPAAPAGNRGSEPAIRPPGVKPVPGLAPRKKPEDPFIGQLFNGRFKIESKLGEGGFGAVYRGVQVQTGRKVALKLLHPEMTRDENLVARFRREGLVLCNLQDPHTITTYDFDSDARRHAVHRDGAARGQEPPHGVPQRGADRVEAGVQDPVADVQLARRGAPPGHRPPRSQAREHLPREPRRRSRVREDPRLRHRQGDARRQLGRPAGAAADRHRPDAGHARVHVARAADGQAARRPQRRLRARRAGLRAADRAPALPRRQGPGGADHRAAQADPQAAVAR
jgi:hypothetical protein